MREWGRWDERAGGWSQMDWCRWEGRAEVGVRAEAGGQGGRGRQVGGRGGGRRRGRKWEGRAVAHLHPDVGDRCVDARARDTWK